MRRSGSRRVAAERLEILEQPPVVPLSPPARDARGTARDRPPRRPRAQARAPVRARPPSARTGVRTIPCIVASQTGYSSRTNGLDQIRSALATRAGYAKSSFARSRSLAVSLSTSTVLIASTSGSGRSSSATRSSSRPAEVADAREFAPGEVGEARMGGERARARAADRAEHRVGAERVHRLGDLGSGACPAAQACRAEAHDHALVAARRDEPVVADDRRGEHRAGRERVAGRARRAREDVGAAASGQRRRSGAARRSPRSARRKLRAEARRHARPSARCRSPARRSRRLRPRSPAPR